MYGDSGSANHAENTVLVKPTAKTKLMKIGLIACSVALFVLMFVVLKIVDMDYLLVPSSVMIIVLEVFGIWYFWKYTSLEYDYLIATGDIAMSVVYGGRSRKDLFKVKISSAELIADCNAIPVSDEQKAEKVYNCTSGPDAINVIYMLFKNEEGKKCIAYFEASAKVLKLLKFYNSSAYKVTYKS